MFRRISTSPISTRLWLLVGIFSAAVVADSLVEIHRDGQHLRAEKELQLEQLVETAQSILQYYEKEAREGHLNEADAKRRAIQTIRPLRYNKVEYFWIHDLGKPLPRMVMHPTMPELEGKILNSPDFLRATSRRNGSQGANLSLDGDNLFLAMNEVAMSPDGRGFVTYDWPKPVSTGGVTTELYPKLSFVKRFEPWGWVVGSGIYMDEFELAYWRAIRLNVFKGGVWLILFGVLVWVILRAIVRPLQSLQDSIEHLRTDPDRNVVLDTDQPRELGKVANSFLSLMGELQQSRRALNASLDELRLAGCVVAEMSEGVIVTDASGRIVSVNPAFLRTSGHTIAEVIGDNPRLLKSGRHDADFYAAMWENIRRSGAWQGEIWNQRKSGEIFPSWITIAAVKDGAGNITHYISTQTDITERKKADDAREEALGRLQKIAGSVPGVVFQLRLSVDGTFRLPFVSEAIREIYRLSPDEVRNDAASAFAVVHPDDLPKHMASLAASAKHLTPWHQEYRLKFDGESDLWLLGNAVPQREADGSVIWHGFITDVTERKQVEEMLRIAATAFESQEGMIITDPGGTILRVNQAFMEITGFAVEDAVGEKMSLLKSGRHDAEFYAAMWASIQSTGSWQGEIWNKRKNGEVYPEWLTITAVKDDAEKVSHYVGTLTDITVRKAAEDEIKHLAFFDPLTLLPNRRLLLDRLRHAMAYMTRSTREGALLFIDLDNFKTLNDTLGHDMGDLLLQQVAQRLVACVREGDTVARLGGDEFVVMLEDLSSNSREAATQTEIVGEKILEVLNEPYQLAGHKHHSTPSIGATLFTDHNNSVDELLKRADLAMYQAKSAGRNTLRFFDPEMQATVTARAALEADLRHGLQQNQFLLYYQAQVDGVGRITGAEVLLRWQHPEHGLVPPALFIPLAKETGLIVPLGQWVLETAFAQLAAWSKRTDMAHLTLAVNVSARQFNLPDFVDLVLAILDKSGAPPENVKLELTESLLLDNAEGIIAKMLILKGHSVGFSMDDFGTGYSSLSYLKRLPLDQLKIDQSFVRDILTDPNDAAIARTVVALAHSLGLGVIAEGVENGGQRDFLAGSGCHAYQGYLYSRPVPLAQFETLCGSNNSVLGSHELL